MAERLIETQHFTCIGRGHGAPCLPANREEWEKMRREPWLADMCRRIEHGDDELKHRLPVWTPSCAEFKDNHRAAADALKHLNRLMMDFDEKGHTDEIVEKLKDAAAPDISGMKILLVEESARRGTHVLVELPVGMDAETAQQLMKDATGFEPDKQVKGVDRCIYMVPEDHTRFVSEQLFAPILGTDSWTSQAAKPSVRGFINKDTAGYAEEKSSVSLKESSVDPCQKEFPTEFRGIAYATIISEFWSRTGGEPSEGERNKRLHQLAANLRAICDNNEEWLLEAMPSYGLAKQEMQSIIHSACKEPTKGSKIIDQIVDALRLDDATQESTSHLPIITPSKLPIGLRESLSGVPEKMHMPVLCSVLPLAAAYADQVEVRYCDGELQKLGMMSIIHGEQASGKSVCKHAVNIWKRQLDQEDELARKREDEWKERKKARKANEKAPEDPKVMIRVVPVTVSCSTLLKRLKNSCGHTLYSFGEELDTLRKTNGAGSWSSKYDIYRLAFDPIDSEWGQDYNSDQAESGVVKVAYNWTMLGTDGAVRKCFKGDNIENGLSSRILLAEMPDTAFAKMPKYGRRSANDESRIQEAVTRLRSYTGFVDTPRLRKAIDQWVEEKRIEAAKDIDRVKDTYRRRAAVIGFRCGVIFHLLSGLTKESKQCTEFAVMMAEYAMTEQIKTFGWALQNQYVDAQTECIRHGVNHSIFDQLPPVFSLNDLAALKGSTTPRNSLIKIISRWKIDGWIEKIGEMRWEKTKTENDTMTK